MSTRAHLVHSQGILVRLCHQTNGKEGLEKRRGGEGATLKKVQLPHREKKRDEMGQEKTRLKMLRDLHEFEFELSFVLSRRMKLR